MTSVGNWARALTTSQLSRMTNSSARFHHCGMQLKQADTIIKYGIIV